MSGGRGSHPDAHDQAWARFNDLPAETLITIFGFSFRDKDGNVRTDYIPILHTLAQVCKTWRDVVIHSPQLWTHIDLSRPKAEWNLALKLSQDSLLDIQARMADQPVDEDDWWTISSHAYGSRWRSLDLDAEWSDALESLQRHHAPNLTSLRLRLPPKNSALVMDYIFAKGAPKLVDVEMETVALDYWAPTCFTHLRKLNLHNIRNYGPSVEMLMEVLQASPKLESLRLFRIRFGSSYGLAEPPVKTELLYLKDLELVTNQPDAAEQIVQRISAPCAAGIVVHVWGPQSWDIPAVLSSASYNSVTSFVGPSLSNHCQRATDLLIGWHLPTGLSLRLMVQEKTVWRFNLLALSIPGGQVADWLSGIKQSEGSPELRSHLTVMERPRPIGMPTDLVGEPTTEELATFLWHYPNVVSLYLPCRTPQDRVWAALSNPRTHSDGSHMWLCPNLITLTVSGSGSRAAELMQQTLGKRAQATSAAAYGSTSGGPTALRSLQISSWDGEGRAVLDQLQASLIVRDVHDEM